MKSCLYRMLLLNIVKKSGTPRKIPMKPWLTNVNLGGRPTIKVGRPYRYGCYMSAIVDTRGI